MFARGEIHRKDKSQKFKGSFWQERYVKDIEDWRKYINVSGHGRNPLVVFSFPYNLVTFY